VREQKSFFLRSELLDAIDSFKKYWLYTAGLSLTVYPFVGSDLALIVRGSGTVVMAGLAFLASRRFLRGLRDGSGRLHTYCMDFVPVLFGYPFLRLFY
jgi:hypothetical protein